MLCRHHCSQAMAHALSITVFLWKRNVKKLISWLIDSPFFLSLVSDQYLSEERRYIHYMWVSEKWKLNLSLSGARCDYDWRLHGITTIRTKPDDHSSTKVPRKIWKRKLSRSKKLTLDLKSFRNIHHKKRWDSVSSGWSALLKWNISSLKPERHSVLQRITRCYLNPYLLPFPLFDGFSNTLQLSRSPSKIFLVWNKDFCVLIYEMAWSSVFDIHAFFFVLRNEQSKLKTEKKRRERM